MSGLASLVGVIYRLVGVCSQSTTKTSSPNHSLTHMILICKFNTCKGAQDLDI